jgi:hypothetical protein
MKTLKKKSIKKNTLKIRGGEHILNPGSCNEHLPYIHTFILCYIKKFIQGRFTDEVAVRTEREVYQNYYKKKKLKIDPNSPDFLQLRESDVSFDSNKANELINQLKETNSKTLKQNKTEFFEK